MKTDIHTPEPQVSTLSGELSLIAPDPAGMKMRDIVIALKNQSRFGGHTLERVSILQHSICVWLMAHSDGASYEDQLFALWHDAPEAYILDIPRPLKHLLGRAYLDIEDVFTAAVGDALDVPLSHGQPLGLKGWDNRALAVECSLWRPREAYEQWLGLPAPSDNDFRCAKRARELAREVAPVILLDRALRDKDERGIREVLA